jgi:ferrous iron transport protein B
MMKLTELKRGDKAKVLSVSGNSEISRRLMEMGFVSGKAVVLIKRAPFSEPLEYDLDGFKITLRKAEADLVNISIEDEPAVATDALIYQENEDDPVLENGINPDITIALVGNPNCGKTSIFNFATGSRERVANYSGVTVAAKEAVVKLDGKKIRLIDLPGTYSLSGQSPDEKFVAASLLHETPDLIINVVDAGNLERNLYLTTQLRETGIKTVIALNMYDELEDDKASLDLDRFEELLGVPIVPTVGKEGKAVKQLFETAAAYHNKPVFMKKTAQLQYSSEIEYAIKRFAEQNVNIELPNQFLQRFYAVSLFAGESYLWTIPELHAHKSELLSIRSKIIQENCEFSDAELERRIVEKRYSYIRSILAKVYKSGDNRKQNISQKIDSVLTHEKFGLPIFFLFVWLMFFLTFRLGEYPMQWIESGIGSLGAGLSNWLQPGVFSDLLINGVIGGVGGVLVFLPSIMILFFMISLMEDSGYMSRSAFLMDKFMQKAGLHGKSFIPLLMGFGCNVPAIMATRTIENKRDRILTMMVIPFMSCSARLPVYVLFISAFFPAHESLLLFAIYGIGILAAFLTSLVLSKTVFSKHVSPFIMELPPYRMPGGKSLLKHTWLKSLHFIKKMGTIILGASIIVWALSYFPRSEETIAKYDASIEMVQNMQAQTASEDSVEWYIDEVNRLEAEKQAELLENSYISKTGKAIQPVFEPMGFDWKMSVSILTGVMAKEVVVSTMGVLYQSEQGNDEGSISLVENLRAEQKRQEKSRLTYFAFLVFILLYFPCFGTLAAMRREIKSWSWMLFAVAFPLSFAWTVSYLIVAIGNLFV